jgi:hypothetical protein
VSSCDFRRPPTTTPIRRARRTTSSPGGDVKADASVTTANNKSNGCAHSVAADAILNHVFVPIPGGASTICGSLGGSDANGCIGVFAAPHDDRVAEDHGHH